MNQATQKQMFDAANYFVTRDGLYVYSHFAKRILPAYDTPIPHRGIGKVVYFDLPFDLSHKGMPDSEILLGRVREECGASTATDEQLSELLGEKYEPFTPDQLAQLIDDGKLLKEAGLNLLYMCGKRNRLYPVRIAQGRNRNRTGWGVDSCPLNRIPWWKGTRVFLVKR
jgi:hypothetical protein